MKAVTHFYVWYPVRIGQEIDLGRTLSAMQDELRRATGVAGRALRRADDPWTWMEIYEDVADADTFAPALEAATQRHGLTRFVEHGARRHIERFVACA